MAGEERKPAAATLQMSPIVAPSEADTPKQAWPLQTADVLEPTVADEDRISLSRKVIFSAPTIATLPFVAMWSMYGNKNYQAFGASLATIALFTALARSFDVVSDPVMSYWTDSASCDKLPKWLRGRRKPFMFFGCFIYSAFLWLLLNPPYAGVNALSLWFGVCYMLYFLSNTLTTIPYDALAPELSDDSNERTGLFFVANLFDGVGTLVALGLPMITTKFSEDYSSRNADICKSSAQKAALCLAGQSCGDFLTTGFDAAYKGNATLISILGNLTSSPHPTDVSRRCAAWLGSHKKEEMLFSMHGSSVQQNDEFCQCINTCGDACDVANQRTGFMLVGSIFAVWFVITMVTAVCRVPERIPSSSRPKAPPIVPSMRSALSNRLFVILLPAWLCDAFVTAITQSLVPYFVEAVVAPAYQTMELNGRDCFRSSAAYDGGKWIGEAGNTDSPKYDNLCSTNMVTAICGLLALVTAILVLPIWKLLVAKIGKVRTWFLWSLTMAASNILFLFIWKGALPFLFVVAAVNGAPLGAKFLADAVLADIIDYDEFLTGMRSEATYFMFKSFLPKIVQIPASAVPIALLGAFHYNPPIGGKVQDQPSGVANYIKFVVGLGFVCSVIAYFLKVRYPLRQERVTRLAEALKLHKEGKWAKDPVSDRLYKPMTDISEEEQEAFWMFNHFSMDGLHAAFLDLPSKLPEEDTLVDRFRRGCIHLGRNTKRQLAGTLFFLVAAITGTGFSMRLLDNEKWQFVPTLFVVAVGIGISSSGFAALRFKAASRLMAISLESEDGKFQLKVERLLKHQAQIARLGRQEDAAHPSSVEVDPSERGSLLPTGKEEPNFREEPEDQSANHFSLSDLLVLKEFAPLRVFDGWGAQSVNCKDTTSGKVYMWECCSQTWKERCLGCAGLNFDALPLAELSHIVQKTGIPGMLATLTEGGIAGWWQVDNGKPYEIRESQGRLIYLQDHCSGELLVTELVDGKWLVATVADVQGNVLGQLRLRRQTERDKVTGNFRRPDGEWLNVITATRLQSTSSPDPGPADAPLAPGWGNVGGPRVAAAASDAPSDEARAEPRFSPASLPVPSGPEQLPGGAEAINMSATSPAATLEQRVQNGEISATEYHKLLVADLKDSPAPRPGSRGQGQVAVLEDGRKVVLADDSESDESC